MIHAPGGAQLRQGKPLFYQEINGSRRAVTGSFTAIGNRAGFSVGDYEPVSSTGDRPGLLTTRLISLRKTTTVSRRRRGRGMAMYMRYGRLDAVRELFPTKNAYQSGQNNDTDEAFITKFNRTNAVDLVDLSRRRAATIGIGDPCADGQPPLAWP